MSGASHFSVVALSALFATTALAADEGRPRIMHAEMVIAGDARPARAVKVAVSPAPAAPAPTARPVLKLPELSAAQELTRQQREMMLATSGPRKRVTKPRAEVAEKPVVQDYSNVHWGYSGLGAPES